MKRYVETATGAEEAQVHPLDSMWCDTSCAGWARDCSAQPYRTTFRCLYFKVSLEVAEIPVEPPHRPIHGCIRCVDCLVNEIAFASVDKIENDDDLERAILRFDQIWHRGPTPEYEHLSAIIAEYETRTVKWPEEST
jgi:hypothetical protein